MFLFESTCNPLILWAEEENLIFVVVVVTEYGGHIHILQRRDEPYIAQIKSVWGIAAFVCVWICITVRASGRRASERRALISQHYVLTHSVFPCRTEEGTDKVTSEQTVSASVLHPAQPEVITRATREPPPRCRLHRRRNEWDDDII